MIRRIVSTLAEAVAEAPLALEDYGKSTTKPSEAAELLHRLIGSEPTEVFVVLLLDAKHRVQSYAEVSRGTLTASLVHPREVFGPAVRLGAASIIVAHNHPSGDPTPSQEDVTVTERLIQAGMLLGIPVLDHIVIGEPTRHASIRDYNQTLFCRR